MTIRELNKYVSAGEGSSIEFKQKLTEPEKILKEVVAFANADGGWLFIGVSDDQKLTGVRDAHEVTNVLDKACRERIFPRINPQVTVLPLNMRKSVVAYYIPAGTKKPYYLNPTDSRKGQAYYRFRDQSIQASKELVKIIKRQKSSRGYLIQYTHRHRSIMHLFQKYENLTIAKIQEECSLSYKAISDTLTSLVVTGVLKMIPSEKEDIYVPKISTE